MRRSKAPSVVASKKRKRAGSSSLLEVEEKEAGSKASREQNENLSASKAAEQADQEEDEQAARCSKSSSSSSSSSHPAYTTRSLGSGTRRKVRRLHPLLSRRSEGKEEEQEQQKRETAATEATSPTSEGGSGKAPAATLAKQRYCWDVLYTKAGQKSNKKRYQDGPLGVFSFQQAGRCELFAMNGRAVKGGEEYLTTEPPAEGDTITLGQWELEIGTAMSVEEFELFRECNDSERKQRKSRVVTGKALEEDNVGFKLMKLMGWTGGSLGKNTSRSPSVQPVEVKTKMDRSGLGYIPKPGLLNRHHHDLLL